MHGGLARVAEVGPVITQVGKQGEAVPSALQRRESL